MKCMLTATLTLLLLATPALAQQDEVARVELGVGFTYLDDWTNDLNGGGLLFDAVINANEPIGIEIELGANVAQVGGIDISLANFMAGPKFTLTRGRVNPYFHMLFGETVFDADVTGFVAETDFAVQPGFGADIWFNDDFGMNFGGDYRHIADGFGGSNEFRILIGIKFGVGSL